MATLGMTRTARRQPQVRLALSPRRPLCDNGAMEMALGSAAVVFALAAAVALRHGCAGTGRGCAGRRAGRALEAQAGVLDTRLAAAQEARLRPSASSPPPRSARPVPEPPRRFRAAAAGEPERRPRPPSSRRRRRCPRSSSRTTSARPPRPRRRPRSACARPRSRWSSRSTTSPRRWRAHGQVQEQGHDARHGVALAVEPRRRRADRRDRARQHAEKLRPRSAGATIVLQATTTDEVTGQRLRPDALVFLPGNSVIVIDCKASKYLLEIAEAEGGEREAEAYANLAPHHEPASEGARRQGLSRRGAGRLARRRARRRDRAASLSIMYLPNEAALEKLCRADPGFLRQGARASRSSRPGRPGSIARCRSPPPRSQGAPGREPAAHRRAAQQLLDGDRRRARPCRRRRQGHHGRRG